jgi:hypothetical protein
MEMIMTQEKLDNALQNLVQIVNTHNIEMQAHPDINPFAWYIDRFILSNWMQVGELVGWHGIEYSTKVEALQKAVLDLRAIKTDMENAGMENKAFNTQFYDAIKDIPSETPRELTEPFMQAYLRANAAAQAGKQAELPQEDAHALGDDANILPDHSN